MLAVLFKLSARRSSVTKPATVHIHETSDAFATPHPTPPPSPACSRAPPPHLLIYIPSCLFLLCTCLSRGHCVICAMVQEAEPNKPSVVKKVKAPKAFPRVAMDLATTVERIQQNFVISDPHLPDCPIVFASDGFLELSEYSREEILGRNCRFLQVSDAACCSIRRQQPGHAIAGLPHGRHRQLCRRCCKPCFLKTNRILRSVSIAGW